MDNLVRLESLTIESIKNVKYGELSFDQLSKIKQGGLNNFNSVLDIYGQNGAGKTTALGTAKILKNVLSGEKLPKDIRQYISLKAAKEIEVESSFFFNPRNLSYIVSKLKDKNGEQLIEVLKLLNIYAHISLIIIENDLIGSINLNSFISVNVLFIRSKTIKIWQCGY